MNCGQDKNDDASDDGKDAIKLISPANVEEPIVFLPVTTAEQKAVSAAMERSLSDVNIENN